MIYWSRSHICRRPSRSNHGLAGRPSNHRRPVQIVRPDGICVAYPSITAAARDIIATVTEEDRVRCVEIVATDPGTGAFVGSFHFGPKGGLRWTPRDAQDDATNTAPLVREG